MKEVDMLAIGQRFYHHRNTLREVPGAVTAAVELLQEDLDKETLEDGEPMSAYHRGAILALIGAACCELSRVVWFAVGETDPGLPLKRERTAD